MIRALIKDNPIKQYREDDTIISDFDGPEVGFQVSGTGTFGNAH
jgi:hypothetical protein